MLANDEGAEEEVAPAVADRFRFVIGPAIDILLLPGGNVVRGEVNSNSIE